MDIIDLCNIEVLDNESVLNVLKKRFQEGQPCTYIGDILLSINAYRLLREDKLNDVPSIRQFSRLIHQSLATTLTSQCFIATGESGSGKTASSHEMCQHFLSLFKGDESVAVKIGKIDCVLEAFGNAHTCLNDNATRYGRYLEVLHTPKLEICGAQVTEYLLESSRVISRNENEQTFHIFFYVFSGRTEDELSRHLLHSPSQHKYLSYGKGFSEDLLVWSKKYDGLLDAFNVIGFSKEDVNGLFGVLSAILNLGDLNYDMEDMTSGVFIVNLDVLDKVAILLGVESDDLEFWLISNNKSSGDDSVSAFKTLEQATKCRDDFCQHLYQRLFGWLVYKINVHLKVEPKSKNQSECVSVGFLDMFGFEELPLNSLEQLCINVANEQLQFYFIQHVFAWEQLEYEQEGIDMGMEEYACNKDLINLLLEKPHGVFALLEEESKCVQADDNTLVSAFNAHCSQHRHYVAMSDGTSMFSVVHFVNKVCYSTEAFLQKNDCVVDRNLLQGLQASNDKIISTLFTSTVSKTGQLNYKIGSGTVNCFHGDLRKQFERRQKQRIMKERNFSTNKASRTKLRSSTSTKRKPKPSLTISQQFRNSLVDLMEKVLLCEPHFLRCIRSNLTNKSDHFDDDVVRSQLHYMGVVDTVRIRRDGFPYRWTFHQFLERFRYICYPLSSNLEYTPDSCSKILNRCELAGWELGKTKLFLRMSHVKKLNEELEKLIAKVIFVQKIVRGHLARIDFDFLKTNRKQEERNLGNLLVSIPTKSKKMYDNLMTLNEHDVKRHEKSKEKEHQRNKENNNVQRKLTKTSSDPDANRTKENLRGAATEGSPNRKVPRVKSRGLEPIVRRFLTSSTSGWCRVDCYEREQHVASYHMDQAVICVDGTHPFSDRNRISFASLPTRSEDAKVAKVKSCIGKGVQLHQDERQNLWATRLGKNPIFVRGHTLCPELVKLNGKLTQGVPMKVLDTAAFKEYIKKECEATGTVTEELRERIMSRLKVCMSFIKDTVVDEETPCWFEIWLLKVNENVKRFLDNYQKRKQHEEKRKSNPFAEGGTKGRSRAPLMRRAKSGESFKPKNSQRRPRSQSGLNPVAVKTPETEVVANEAVTEKAPIYTRKTVASNEFMRREKSMDVRLEQRLLMEHRNNNNGRKLTKTDSPSNSPDQSRKTNGCSRESSVNQLTVNSRSFDSSPPEQLRNQPKAGMSYRQVFDIQSSNYLFNVTPPNYTRHRRFSDSDTESLQNFVRRFTPQEDGRNKVLQNIQPKRWMKKVRRKSEDMPKRKVIAAMK